jgi:hypothetical protein
MPSIEGMYTTSRSVKKSLIAIFTGLGLVSVGIQPALALPTVGMGAGQVMVIVGVPDNQPGSFNTQFWVNGSPYTFPATAAVGAFLPVLVNYSVDTSPHAQTIYASPSRPTSLNGQGLPTTIPQSSNSAADATFTPPAGATDIVVCWTLTHYPVSVNSPEFLTICSDRYPQSGVQQGSGSPANSSAPKYSGPEFSSFGDAVVSGDSAIISGKKLDSISSMKINGTPVTFKAKSESELEVQVPVDLAPGKYDIEITSTHGKLTHLQGLVVKAIIPTKELAFKASGVSFQLASLLDLTNAAKQISSDYTSVKCIVNAADPVVAERLARRACAYIEANRLRGKDVTYESKSTYKGEGFWVKVVANG